MAAVVQKWSNAQAREAAVSIVRALREAGHEAYFAGGCVRDELLGLDPTDYDIATDARPDAIRAMFPRTAAVGASFGVVLVRERVGSVSVTVEVATFRSDGPYSDSRRPDHVEFADAAHDAQRRDFTINALFLDPLAAEDSPSIHGHVIDHVGGMADLRAALIRAVGDPERRLAEDHLRALRAVRFAARYGFEIEPTTAGAIREHAGDLAGVSRERIGEELRRMLADPNRARAATLLAELGLARVVLGDEPAQAQNPPRAATPRTLARLAQDAATLPASLAALAFDRGQVAERVGVPALVRQWRRGLCLSNDETARLRAVVEGVHEMESAWGGLGVAERKRLAASPWFVEALAVVMARDAKVGKRVSEDVGELAADGIGLAPESWVTGHDLLGLNLAPGPVFARVLDETYDAQLDGRVRDRESALRFAAELARAGGV